MTGTRSAAVLPEPYGTAFQYSPVSQQGRIVFLAGQIPKTGNNELLHVGKCGKEVTLEQARACAALSAEQGLAWINRECGGLANVERILRMDVFIATHPDFDGLSAIADAATERMTEYLGGAAARCPRSVIGVLCLPRNAPVLVELTVSLRREVAA